MQREAIEAVLGGRDVLLLLSTGGGKSLTFQLPALFTGNMALVISPLLALINNQTNALLQKGIVARQWHSGVRPDEIDTLALDLANVDVLYTTPEQIMTSLKLDRALRTVTVSLIALDEAHCIEKWGDVECTPILLMII